MFSIFSAKLTDVFEKHGILSDVYDDVDNIFSASDAFDLLEKVGEWISYGLEKDIDAIFS